MLDSNKSTNFNKKISFQSICLCIVRYDKYRYDEKRNFLHINHIYVYIFTFLSSNHLHFSYFQGFFLFFVFLVFFFLPFVPITSGGRAFKPKLSFFGELGSAIKHLSSSKGWTRELDGGWAIAPSCHTKNLPSPLFSLLFYFIYPFIKKCYLLRVLNFQTFYVISYYFS